MASSRIVAQAQKTEIGKRGAEMAYRRCVARARQTEMAPVETEMVGAQSQTGGCDRDVYSIRDVVLHLKRPSLYYRAGGVVRSESVRGAASVLKRPFVYHSPNWPGVPPRGTRAKGKHVARVRSTEGGNACSALETELRMPSC